jgi:hypothetical protein
LVAATLVAVAAVVGTGYSLSRVVGDLRAADRALDAASTLVRDGETGAAAAELSRAESALARANGRLQTSAFLDVARVVPLVRQNLQGLDRSVELAFLLASGGRRLLDGARPLEGAGGRIELALRGGRVPLDAILPLRRELKDVAFGLPGAVEGTSRWLVGPVRSLHADLEREAVTRRGQFVSLGRALDLLAEMSGGNGPRRYLIAVANAAEMRGSGGMILSYGVVAGDGGQLVLERFGSVDEIALPAPAPASLPPDFLSRFGSLGPTLLWRNANLSSDFVLMGPVLESMGTSVLGPIDGVVQIDSMGLAGILRGIGPVDVPDVGLVDAGNVVALTLNELYVRFPDRSVRQEHLGAIAEAVFRRLLSGDYPSVRALGEGLADAVTGRNILVHASRAAAERTVTHLGADGSLPVGNADFVHLAVQNFSANKLDYYVDTALRLRGERRPDRLSRVVLTVELANTAPPGGSPPYIFGPFNRSLAAGEYRGLVTVYLPRGTSLARGSPVPNGARIDAEAGRSALTFSASVLAGDRAVYTFDLRLPPVPSIGYQFVVVPSPRVRPTTLDLELTLAGASRSVRGPLVGTVVLP